MMLKGSPRSENSVKIRSSDVDNRVESHPEMTRRVDNYDDGDDYDCFDDDNDQSFSGSSRISRIKRSREQQSCSSTTESPDRKKPPTDKLSNGDVDGSSQSAKDIVSNDTEGRETSTTPERMKCQVLNPCKYIMLSPSFF